MRHQAIPAAFTRQQRLLLALLPPLAVLLLHLLGRTLRIHTVSEAGAHPADRTDAPDVYAFFHRCLLLAAWQYRHRGIHILISASFDGELIARTVARMGFVPVRGSSSRGGMAGLLHLTAARRNGHKVALTVDGPRGPAGVSKPGAVLVAQRAGSSVSAFALHPHLAWTLRSWDRFLIPKPFSRVTAVWAAPLPIAPQGSIADANTRLQAALDHAAAAATSLH